MKKGKFILGVLLAGTFVIAGCTKGGDVKKDSNQILFNGGNVAVVGDNIFYANGFASGVDGYNTKNEDEYKAAQKYAYLARINKNNLSSTKFENSSETKKISDKLSGFSNSYMFVLKDHIYFATPNIEKTSGNLHVWNYVTIMKAKLDGSDAKSIFTTKDYNSSYQIRALSTGGENYLVVYDGNNLTKITLGKDKVTEIASGVSSVALSDEDESFNGIIYYTVDRNSTNGQVGTRVKSYNLKSGESGDFGVENDISISFTGRVEDMLFYTRSYRSNNTSSNEVESDTYIVDAKKLVGNISFSSLSKYFYADAISNVDKIGAMNPLYEGYIFSYSSDVYYYNLISGKNPIYEPERILDSDDGYVSSVVIYDTDLYFSTSDSIKMFNVISKNEPKNIVSGMIIQTGNFGYDYFYIDGNISGLNDIYFYAQIPENEDEEDSQSDETKDENYYLYKVDHNGEGNEPVMVGKKA